MTDGIVGLLSLLVTSVIGGLFALIWRLFARLDKVEKRVDRAEQAIFEEQIKGSILSFAYENVRQLGLDLAEFIRGICGRTGEALPAAVALVESKPPVEALIAEAEEHARAEVERRRDSYAH
jgi:predicted amino acid dehydrogenase